MTVLAAVVAVVGTLIVVVLVRLLGVVIRDINRWDP